MGRRFTPSTSDRITVENATDLAGFDWVFGTWAFLFYRSVDTAGVETFMATNNAGAGANSTFIGSTDLFGCSDAAASNFTGAVAAASGPWLLGWTKATGTNTPRGHKYQFNTNTWTHNAGSTTVDNGTGPSSLIFGSATIAGSVFVNGEFWAIGAWKRNMTDKEFERLSAGNWLNTAPDFYEQWTDGREVTAMKSTLGRFPVRQTSMTGTTRGVQRPPPGFRMAIQRRRR